MSDTEIKLQHGRKALILLSWLVHLHHGVSRGGGRPSDSEWESVLAAAGELVFDPDVDVPIETLKDENLRHYCREIGKLEAENERLLAIADARKDSIIALEREISALKATSRHGV